VVSVLRGVQPLLGDDPVIVQGFRAWAASISPAAGEFIDEITRQTSQRGLDAVSVIVLPRPTGA
jgi:hypothetical protein